MELGMRGWRVRSKGEKDAILSDGKSELILERDFAVVFFREHDSWERHYLPSFPLAGKTVLDVGAGCGETAWFFFEHGASKVIGVEPHPRRAELFAINSKRNGWRTELIQNPLSAELLSIPHDFVKIDCEGGESVLLEDPDLVLGPCRIEIHGKQLETSLSEMFNLKRFDNGIFGLD